MIIHFLEFDEVIELSTETEDKTDQIDIHQWFLDLD